jgi:hypothetical protein
MFCPKIIQRQCVRPSRLDSMIYLDYSISVSQTNPADRKRRIKNIYCGQKSAVLLVQFEIQLLCWLSSMTLSLPTTA